MLYKIMSLSVLATKDMSQNFSFSILNWTTPLENTTCVFFLPLFTL